MKNRKNTILAIAFIPALVLTTGCSISITRNRYDIFPEQNNLPTSIKTFQNDYRADSVNDNKNGQNE